MELVVGLMCIYMYIYIYVPCIPHVHINSHSPWQFYLYFLLSCLCIAPQISCSQYQYNSFSVRYATAASYVSHIYHWILVVLFPLQYAQRSTFNEMY